MGWDPVLISALSQLEEGIFSMPETSLNFLYGMGWRRGCVCMCVKGTKLYGENCDGPG